MRISTSLVFAVVGFAITALIPLRADDSAAPSTAERKFTFVIVHGAWAGGWEWKKLGDALHADGHTVYRPTLTGQGERFHLATPNVDLSLHIQDIVNFIEWENLRDIVLVGHSYGGMVIAGVVDQLHDRIKRVIYLDAFLPENGESARTSMGPERASPRPSVDGFISLGDQTGKPVPHVVPQSEKTFTQSIVLRHQDVAQKLPTTYILTVDKGKVPSDDGFFRCYERAKSRGWKTVVMEGDHIVHVTKTKELAQLLEQTP